MARCEAPGEDIEQAKAAGAPVRGAEEEMPRVVLTRRQIVLFAVFILSGIAFLYFVLPKLAGVGTTVRRIERGDTWWIVVGVVLELASFAGYVVLFRAVFVRDSRHRAESAGVRATRSRWPDSWPRACSPRRARAAWH